MRLILVRHGATEWSVSGQHTGNTDMPLTAAGLVQAEQARQRVLAAIGDVPWQAWSSPLVRARDTADLVVGPGRFALDGRLREVDYGDYEGLTKAQIHAIDPGWTVWTGCPGGETMAAVQARIDALLADVRAAAPAVAVLFAHGHLLRILAARALGQPGAFGAHLYLDTASVSEIHDRLDGPAITRWNDVGSI